MTVVTRRHTVNMTDVDLVQVNYARFFVWMDDAYDAILRDLHNPLSRIVADGFATPVVDARCEYRRPVSLDDEFHVRSAIVSTGQTSYVVAHRFEDFLGTFAIGKATHVWIRTDPAQRAEPLPHWVRDAVEAEFLNDIEGRS